MSPDVDDRPRSLVAPAPILLAVLLVVVGVALVFWFRSQEAQRRAWEQSVEVRRQVRDIHSAALEGDLATVRRLLDQGVAVDARDVDGTTPLHGAAGNRHIEIVRLLIERGADVNAQDSIGRSVLRYNMIGMDAQTVRLLLEHGADPSIADKQGITPLDVAQACGFHEIVDLLRRGKT